VFRAGRRGVDLEYRRRKATARGRSPVIGQIKKRSDIPVYDPGREKKVLLNVQRHNDGPLSDEAVRRLFERIIDETRAVERQRYQQIKDEPEDK
jgi:hypothetical protein